MMKREANRQYDVEMFRMRYDETTETKRGAYRKFWAAVPAMLLVAIAVFAWEPRWNKDNWEDHPIWTEITPYYGMNLWKPNFQYIHETTVSVFHYDMDQHKTPTWIDEDYTLHVVLLEAPAYERLFRQLNQASQDYVYRYGEHRLVRGTAAVGLWQTAATYAADELEAFGEWMYVWYDEVLHIPTRTNERGEITSKGYTTKSRMVLLGQVTTLNKFAAFQVQNPVFWK
jgi:hypothetical protein